MSQEDLEKSVIDPFADDNEDEDVDSYEDEDVDSYEDEDVPESILVDLEDEDPISRSRPPRQRGVDSGVDRGNEERNRIISENLELKRKLEQLAVSADMDLSAVNKARLEARHRELNGHRDSIEGLYRSSIEEGDADKQVELSKILRGLEREIDSVSADLMDSSGKISIYKERAGISSVKSNVDPVLSDPMKRWFLANPWADQGSPKYKPSLRGIAEEEYQNLSRLYVKRGMISDIDSDSFVGEMNRLINRRLSASGDVSMNKKIKRSGVAPVSRGLGEELVADSGGVRRFSKKKLLNDIPEAKKFIEDFPWPNKENGLPLTDDEKYKNYFAGEQIRLQQERKEMNKQRSSKGYLR